MNRAKMGASPATRVQRLRKGHCVVQFLQVRSADVVGAKPAGRHLFPKQVDGISKMTDGNRRRNRAPQVRPEMSPCTGSANRRGHGVENCCVELVCEGMRRLLSWDEKGDRKGESSTAGNRWRHVPPGVTNPPTGKRLQHQARANRLMLCRKIQTECACNQQVGGTIPHSWECRILEKVDQARPPREGPRRGTSSCPSPRRQS